MSDNDLLEDQIKNADVFNKLYTADRITVNQAKEVLRESPIGGLANDEIDQVWFNKNLRVQQELLSLKTRIDYIANKQQIQLYNLEGKELDSGDYEFVKSRDERIAKLMTNPVLRDKKTTLGTLQVLSSYVEGLLWNLRDVMKLFKK